jgi:hypothetical protein
VFSLPNGVQIHLSFLDSDELKLTGPSNQGDGGWLERQNFNLQGICSLKKIFWVQAPDLSLDKEVLEAVIQKNGWSLPA